jgi:hypothetical protein
MILYILVAHCHRHSSYSLLISITIVLTRNTFVLGDVIVDVPGGSNNYNYANVTLIVELRPSTRRSRRSADGGHASENPVLPGYLVPQ